MVGTGVLGTQLTFEHARICSKRFSTRPCCALGSESLHVRDNCSSFIKRCLSDYQKPVTKYVSKRRPSEKQELKVKTVFKRGG